MEIQEEAKVIPETVPDQTPELHYEEVKLDLNLERTKDESVMFPDGPEYWKDVNTPVTLSPLAASGQNLLAYTTDEINFYLLGEKSNDTIK